MWRHLLYKNSFCPNRLMAPRVFSVKGDTDFRLPLALAGSSLLHAICSWAALNMSAGSKKVRFPALSNQPFEMFGVNMIRPKHGGEAIESASPPVMKRDRIKVRVNHTPACFY